MLLPSVPLSGAEAPSVFSPLCNFGAGSDSRRHVEIESASTDGPSCGQAAVYAYARAAADRLGVRRVVEMGTGTGTWLRSAFSGFAGELVQTDWLDGRVSPPEGASLPRFITVHPEDTGDLQHLADELTDETATLYLLSDVLERLMDPRALLRVLRRLLRLNPANRLVLSTPERPEIGPGSARLPEDPRHVRQWSSDELADALRSSGFVIHHLERVSQDAMNSPARTVVAEVGCTPLSYRAFLAQHRLPASCDHLVIATVPPEPKQMDGSAEETEASPLLLLTGADGLPADWRGFVSERGWMHSARFTDQDAASGNIARLDTEDVLNAVLQVVFLYDELRLIQYQDYMGIGLHVAQAKRARLLPPSVAVVATAIGAHFYLDHAQGNISKTRALQVDVRERLSLELADAVIFPSRFLRDLYLKNQGLELRHHVLLPHPAWNSDAASVGPGLSPSLVGAPWPHAVREAYLKTLEEFKAYTPKAPAPRGAVTVVTPNFNGKAHFFKDYTHGLHHSYHRPEQIVFVDDGSTPEGLAVLQQAGAELAPIPTEIFRLPENLGSSHARNVGLAQVKTPYLCAHDNDNFVSNRFLDLACRILDENPDVAVVTTWAMGFIDGDDWMSEGEDMLAFEYHPLGPDIGLGLHVNCFGDTMAVYRVEAIRAMGGWDTSLEGRREDRQLFLRLTAIGQKIWVLPLPSFLYRRHPHSRMRTKPEFDGWMRLGRSLPGVPFNQAFGLVRAANVSQAGQAEAAHAAMAARLQEIESSTIWRASSAARQLVGAHPTLRFAIRGLLRTCLRLARRLRS